MTTDSYDEAGRGGSIQTFSGGIFYPLDPRANEINLIDVAHALGNKARFTGHTRILYSTGEHSVRVSWLLRSQGHSLMRQYVGLHHDDSDAYLPDVPTPLKKMPEFAWFREIEHKVQEKCYERFGCVIDDYSVVKEVDTILLLTEKRDLMPEKNGNWNTKFTQVPIPKPYEIEPWPPEHAKLIYLAAHRELVNALLQSEPSFRNPGLESGSQRRETILR